MKADRISGLAVLLAGLAMIFAIIPAYVETAEAGVIQPATLPYALCWLITACGAWLVARPGDTSPPPAHQLRRAAMHAGAGWRGGGDGRRQFCAGHHADR